MQRIFSTFPGAWPGFALLLLRCVAAAALIAYASGGMWLSLEPDLLLMHGLTISVAALLIGGLWTPLAGIAQALLGLYSSFSGPTTADLNHMLWAAVGLCVAMLGPGACSVDSRLFGRRRIDVRRFGRLRT
jgi:putative oxidoreductase